MSEALKKKLTLFKEGPTALRGPFKITDSDFLPAILEVALAVPTLPTPTLLLLVVFAVEEEINAIEDTDDDKDVISVPELTGKVALGNGDGVPLGGPWAAVAATEGLPTKFVAIVLLLTVVAVIRLDEGTGTEELFPLFELELFKEWSREFTWFFTSEK